MADDIDALFSLYARCYTDGDLQGLAALCLTPFVAVRRGEVILLPDHGAVLTHFTSTIDAYRRAADARTWTPRELSTIQLGAYSAFVTAHWNAHDADGNVVRDSLTSYQLLTSPDGWRFLSYTNHF